MSIAKTASKYRTIAGTNYSFHQGLHIVANVNVPIYAGNLAGRSRDALTHLAAESNVHRPIAGLAGLAKTNVVALDRDWRYAGQRLGIG